MLVTNVSSQMLVINVSLMSVFKHWCIFQQIVKRAQYGFVFHIVNSNSPIHIIKLKLNWIEIVAGLLIFTTAGGRS